jgi:hypothetical protein
MVRTALAQDTQHPFQLQVRVERSRYAAEDSEFRASQILAHWCFPQVAISGCLLTAGQQTGWLCDQPNNNGPMHIKKVPPTPS